MGVYKLGESAESTYVGTSNVRRQLSPNSSNIRPLVVLLENTGC